MARRKSRNKEFLNVPVVDAGAKGKAIAKTDEGAVIFLQDAVPGDVVDVMTYKKKKSFYEGNVTKTHIYSEHRTEPVCIHFGTCGGCKWQNMKYESQLHFKNSEVINNLTRLGHQTMPDDTRPILGSASALYYRNKMEFSFSANRWLTRAEIETQDELGERRGMGFHIPGMWDKVLDLTECHLHSSTMEAVRSEVHAYSMRKGYSYFNPRTNQGWLRTLMLRESVNGEMMVVVQFGEEREAERIELLEHLKETFPNLTSLQYIINLKQNDTIYDQDIICYHGRDYIVEEMEGLKFRVNAKSFYQTNATQAYELYKLTREAAGLTGKETVYDLYTGTGTIAQFVAAQAGKVVGIESVPEAIADAKLNAENNGLDNCTFLVGDMRHIFTQELIEAHGRPDVLITDPPRVGMHKDVVAQLLDLEVPRIVYVSCNSATQARDLQLLSEKYELTYVQPVDMFPQTHHVENIVRLELKNQA